MVGDRSLVRSRPALVQYIVPRISEKHTTLNFKYLRLHKHTVRNSLMPIHTNVNKQSDFCSLNNMHTLYERQKDATCNNVLHFKRNYHNTVRAQSKLT